MNTALQVNDWSFLTHEDQFSLNLSHATLFECIDEYTKAKSVNHPSVARATRTLKFHLEHLQNALKIELMPKHITSIFYPKFIEYLRNQSLKITSIELMCRYIRQVISWASDYNAVVHPSYKDIDIPKYKRKGLALSASDISKIYHFNFDCYGLNPRTRRTYEDMRNAFVLAANLGQRYSDIVRIGKECFSDGRFRIVQQKTKNKACVDMYRMCIDRKIADEILEKYNYDFPYKGSLRTYNYHLHNMMRLIFPDEYVDIPIVEGNLAATKRIPKADAIASHTARRTFATHNYVEMERSVHEVMKGTGHADYKSFSKYICEED